MFWYGMSACVSVWYARVCIGIVCARVYWYSMRARLYWFGMRACVLVWYERVCFGMV